jgi:ferredoxin-2, mitochondrial
MIQTKGRLARAEEVELLALVKGPKRNTVDHHYRLGTIYFDRRMLKSAEVFLKRAHELASILHGMETIRKQAAKSAEVSIEENTKWPYCHSVKLKHEHPTTPSYSTSRIEAMQSRLGLIQQDLDYVRGLQKKYWRCGPDKFLPCLLRRFGDHCDCDEWLRSIRHAPTLIWDDCYLSLLSYLPPVPVVCMLSLHRLFARRFASSQNVSFSFINKNGSITGVTAPVGKTVLEVAHDNNIEIEGACEGALACSTCHVILEQAVFDKLGEPTEREDDLLDLAPGLSDTSRLSCQIKVDEGLEGTTFRLPKATLNFYVDGHVPKPH